MVSSNLPATSLTLPWDSSVTDTIPCPISTSAAAASVMLFGLNTRCHSHSAHASKECRCTISLAVTTAGALPDTPSQLSQVFPQPEADIPSPLLVRLRSSVTP